MRKLATLVFVMVVADLLLSGCAAPGPNPEQLSREMEQQREAERQQAEFRKGLPPVANPGRGE